MKTPVVASAAGAAIAQIFRRPTGRQLRRSRMVGSSSNQQSLSLVIRAMYPRNDVHSHDRLGRGDESSPSSGIPKIQMI